MAAGADIVARMILQTGNVTSGVASMSSKLKAEAEGIAASNATIGSSAKKAASEVNQSSLAANKMSYNWGTMFKGAEGSMGGFFNRMDSGTTKMSLMERAGASVSGAMGTLKTKISGVATSIGNMDMMSSMMLAGAGLGILAFFGKAVQAAGDFQDQWTTFGITMGKTGSDTSAIMSQWGSTYQSIQDTTGRSQTDIMSGLDKLSIAGVKSTDLMTRSMDDLGGAAFQTHNSMGTLEDAFQRNVQSTGLQQRSLKAMGINMADLSAVSGKSASDITKDWKTMTASQKAALLDSAMEYKDGTDANAKYKASYQGLLQAAKNAFQGIEIAVGKSILPVLIPVLTTAASAVKGLGQGFGGLPKPIQQVIDVVGLLAGAFLTLGGMAAILKPIITPLKAMGSAIQTVYGYVEQAIIKIGEYIASLDLIPSNKSTTVTETVNKVTNTTNNGGPPGPTTPQPSWYSQYIQPASSAITTAGAYVVGRGSSTIASIGARIGGAAAGASLGGIARGAASLATGIPGIGEGVMGLFEPGQMFGRALTPFEKTATPYQQRQAALAADPNYDAQGNYIGPNWTDAITKSKAFQINPKVKDWVGGALGNTQKFFSGPNPLSGLSNWGNSNQAYARGAIGNTGAYLSGALGNTGSYLSGALGNTGSWLGSTLGFLRPGGDPVYGADGKPKPSIMSDITSSTGILRGTGLESGGWINQGVSGFMKNPGGAISGALGSAGSAIGGALGSAGSSISGALGGIKLPSAGDILKTIQSDLHIPNFQIPSVSDILSWIQNKLHIPSFKIPSVSDILSWIQNKLHIPSFKIPSVSDILSWIQNKLHIPSFKIPSVSDILSWIQNKLHIPSFKIPSLGQILSWIQSHIPQLNWKIPTLGSILSWIQSHIPQLNWKIPTLGSILSWIQNHIPKLNWKIPSWNDIANWIKGKISWLSWSIPSWGNIASWIQGKISWLSWSIPSWGDIYNMIASRIHNFIWPSGPGGVIGGAIHNMERIHNVAVAAKNAITHPIQTVESIGSAIGGAVTNVGNYIIGAAQNTWNWLTGRGPNNDDGPRGPIDMLKGAMSGFKFEDYPGHKKSFNEVLSSGAGNCFDLTTTGMTLASMLGIPSSMVWGSWKGGSHVWGSFGGQQLDFARDAIDHTLSPPPRGPSNQSNESSRPIIVQNIFKGPVYGLPDFEDQVEDKTVKALNKHLGGIL